MTCPDPAEALLNAIWPPPAPIDPAGLVDDWVSYADDVLTFLAGWPEDGVPSIPALGWQAFDVTALRWRLERSRPDFVTQADGDGTLARLRALCDGGGHTLLDEAIAAFDAGEWQKRLADALAGAAADPLPLCRALEDLEGLCLLGYALDRADHPQAYEVAAAHCMLEGPLYGLPLAKLRPARRYARTVVGTFRENLAEDDALTWQVSDSCGLWLDIVSLGKEVS